jgi:hypothetical protein
MSKALLILCAVLVLMPIGAAAQDDQQTKPKQDPTAQLAIPPPKGPPVPSDRFIRTLTNVQIELTLTDQLGHAPAEKKTVSMIVASGSWGKIRNTAASVGPLKVGLNVDARPFVSTEGPVQLELTIYYYPPQGKPEAPVLPTELNQSMTIVLQSGKPMLISQSADPASDRKVTVEVKATVLK